MNQLRLCFRFAPGLFLLQTPSGNLISVYEPSDSFVALAIRFGDALGWD